MLDIDVTWKRQEFSLNARTCFAGGISGLCGISGSGKSTLLSLIAGLQHPDSGHIALNGRTLVNTTEKIFLPPEQRHIGLVFQDALLFPHLSAHGNLLYGYHHRQKKDRRFTPDDIISLLEIGNLLTRTPRHLSGGEKQRIALGRALLYSPELLLLDEPLASLDGQRKSQILPFLLRIRDELEMPMIYVSHSMEEVSFLTTKIWQVDNGKVISPDIAAVS